MKRRKPPPRRLPSTRTFIIIGVALLAVLAIAIPMRVARNRRVAVEECFARMKRLATALMKASQQSGTIPQSLSDAGAVVKEEVVLCPHPQGSDAQYLFELSTYALSYFERPEDGTLVAYCIEHTKWNGKGGLALPLQGTINYIVYPDTTLQTDASKLERWLWKDKKWERIPETGEIPKFPEVWRFPGEAWPPKQIK